MHHTRPVTALLAAVAVAVAAPAAQAQTSSYDDPLLSGYGDSGALEQTLFGPTGLRGGGSGPGRAPSRSDGTVDLRATSAAGAAAEADAALLQAPALRRTPVGGDRSGDEAAAPAPAGAPAPVRLTGRASAAPLPLAEIAGVLALLLVALSLVAAGRRGRPAGPAAI